MGEDYSGKCQDIEGGHAWHIPKTIKKAARLKWPVQWRRVSEAKEISQ